MQVMCIHKNLPRQEHPDLIKAAEEIQVGSIYQVVLVTATHYELAEFPHPRTILWDKECFAKLSEESAEEMAELERESIIK